MDNTTMEITTFEQLNLSPEMLRAVKKKRLTVVTPVQAQTIPPMMEWKDIIAKAPTGTGKTFAFGIPVIEHIDPENPQIQALILAPARELAIQISSELRGLTEFKNGVRTLCIYGGQSIEAQIGMLKKHPQIIVATPGRLLDHIQNRRTIKLDGVQTAVIDEADRMVDMGFYKDVTRILDYMPGRKNLALLSATLSNEVMTLGWTYQRDAVEITVAATEDNKPDIMQYSMKTTESGKVEAMANIIKENDYERILIFCNTKRRVERLTKLLEIKEYRVACIHGDVRQNAREKALEAFRRGQVNILVATDVASRGIDVNNIDAVFNYDIPEENEYYIHRIGRTGRAKKSGAAYTLIASFSDDMRLGEIAKYTKYQISPMRSETEPTFPVEMSGPTPANRSASHARPRRRR